MLTGDNNARPRRSRGRLGIDDVEAEVLPEDKARIVQQACRPRAGSSPWRATA